MIPKVTVTSVRVLQRDKANRRYIYRYIYKFMSGAGSLTMGVAGKFKICRADQPTQERVDVADQV